jgi:hypothetical protein
VRSENKTEIRGNYLTKNKSLFILLAVISLSFLIYQWGKATPQEAMQWPRSVSTSAVEPQAVRGQSVHEELSDVSHRTGPEEEIPAGLTRLREKISWGRSRGYLTEADLEAYASYDLETLEALSAGGDILANSALAHGYIRGSFEAGSMRMLLDKTHAAWREGVVIGSTRAIAGAARRAEGKALGHEDFHSPEAKADFIEAMAWFELGYLRGDRDVLRKGLGTVRQFDITFSPPEIKEINRRARALYEEFESERLARGFGPFDDTRPPVSANWGLFPRPKDWGRDYYDDVVAQYRSYQAVSGSEDD